MYFLLVEHSPLLAQSYSGTPSYTVPHSSCSYLAVDVEVLAEGAETTGDGTVGQHPGGILAAL